MSEIATNLPPATLDTPKGVATIIACKPSGDTFIVLAALPGGPEGRVDEFVTWRAWERNGHWHVESGDYRHSFYKTTAEALVEALADFNARH